MVNDNNIKFIHVKLNFKSEFWYVKFVDLYKAGKPRSDKLHMERYMQACSVVTHTHAFH